MRNETRNALQLFIEKANELKAIKFAESAKQVNFSWSWKRDEEKVEVTGPDREEIAAFILTFRFFIQKNEHTSFCWLANNVLDDPGLSDHWKQEFREIRGRLNQYLDSSPSIQMFFKNDPPPTNRKIMDFFIYGYWAHANEVKRETVERWMSSPLAYGLITTQFIAIIRTSLEYITYMAQVSTSELEK